MSKHTRRRGRTRLGSLVLFVAATLFLVATPPARELRSWTAGTRAHACPPAC